MRAPQALAVVLSLLSPASAVQKGRRIETIPAVNIPVAPNATLTNLGSALPSLGQAVPNTAVWTAESASGQTTARLGFTATGVLGPHAGDGERTASPQAKDQPADPASNGQTSGSASKLTSKVGRILKRMASLFQSEPERLSVEAAERVADYERFSAKDHWTALREPLESELAALRALATKERRREFLRRAGEEIVERLKTRGGSAELGFHYNLHGGQAREYAAAGMIRATRGDIALQYDMHAKPVDKVYFFRSGVNLYDILDESHPQMLLFPSRMGSVLILFRADAPALQSSGVQNPSAISLDFDSAKLRGVPYEAFLAPPLEVFSGTAKKLGLGKLSRDEETLATMRLIEAAVLDPDNPLARP